MAMPHVGDVVYRVEVAPAADLIQIGAGAANHVQFFPVGNAEVRGEVFSSFFQDGALVQVKGGFDG